METASRHLVYTEVDPRCEWVAGENFDTLLVDVSGFKKEQLKVQVDTSRNLKISGEQTVDGNRRRRFLKSFQLPKDCDAKMIKANFGEGILYVTVPRPINPDPQQGNVSANNEQGDPSVEAVADDKVFEPEDTEQGMAAVAEGLKKYRQLMVNTILGIVVVVGLGIYVGYKLKYSRRAA